jgi:hypothetical protein
VAAHDRTRTSPSHPARIRALLRRATQQEEVERFWSLAVACQLIDEHLAALRDHPATRPTQARRRAGCCQAWTARLERVQAALRQHRAGAPPRHDTVGEQRAPAQRQSSPGARPTPA